MTRPEHARRIRPSDVGRFAREVVARRLLIVAFVTGAARLVVAQGWLPAVVGERAEQITGGVIDVIALGVAIFYVRRATTPADPTLAPRSTNGLPLVESHFDEGGHVAPLPPPGGRHVDPAARADLRHRLGDEDVAGEVRPHFGPYPDGPGRMT